VMRGEFAEALKWGRASLERDPENARTRHNMGQACSRSGDLTGAIEHFRHASRLEPRSARRQRKLAEALMQAGELEQAAMSYRTALSMEFTVDEANLLARILATHRDARVRNGNEALALAERMVGEGDDANAMLLDTLGTALAEVGRFEDAVDAAERALRAPVPEGMGALIQGIEARLQLYRQHRAYRM